MAVQFNYLAKRGWKPKNPDENYIITLIKVELDESAIKEVKGKSIKNNAWISDDEINDPKILPDLPGYHILVRPISIKAETKGGILLPDAIKEDISYLTTVGRVLKIGDLAYKDMEKFPNGAWCDVNDHICYGLIKSIYA